MITGVGDGLDVFRLRTYAACCGVLLSDSLSCGRKNVFEWMFGV
jgi:biotin operon repressor